MQIQQKSFKILNCLTAFFILGSLLFPLASLAGSYKIGNNNITYDGLVPCGKCLTTSAQVTANDLDEKQCGVPSGSPTNTKYISCQFCHFFVMFDGLVKFILTLVIIIAVLMFVVAGAMFLLAGGTPGNVQKARSILTSTAWGLVIIFASWIAVNTIFIFIGVSDWTGLRTGWFTINCPISL